MKVIEFIRLLRKHMVVLILSPLLLALLVIILTRDPDYRYSSKTTLYTGIATGSSVEMDKSFNYFANNTAFDNLINIIKSRDSQQETAIRLLSQHLMLEKPDPEYISEESFAELRRITPAYVKELVVKNGPEQAPVAVNPDMQQMPLDTAQLLESFSFQMDNDSSNPEVPSYVSLEAYEQTVKNLTELMMKSDTNFVYKLLNFPNPHYSFKDISQIKVQRIGNSDLVDLEYETDDPGICQQTLVILTNVCIRNYRGIKENRSDAVVKYFEHQLKQASDRLKGAEDKLLEFNKENNIINYYEQSKAVAVVKEDLDVEYNNKRIQLAGLQAAIKRLEDKMGTQEQIQLKSTEIMESRNRLGAINYEIASIETFNMTGKKDFNKLEKLKAEAEALKEKIKADVGELYSFGNSKEGVPLSSLLNEWLTNVIEAENIKAGIDVLGERIKEFQKQYAIYAPAGANIKRIEREISVSEQEFLEILHGLNQAKLKLQDNELSSNIKIVDPAYFPLSPIPTSRKVLVVLAFMMGFIFVLGGILLMEYLDQSLKDPLNASRVLKMSSVGLIPKILLNVPNVPITTITNRLLEITIQNTELYFKELNGDRPVKTLLFFSTQKQEGKSVLAGNLALQFKKKGKKVLFLNYRKESLPVYASSLQENATDRMSNDELMRQQKRPSVISRMLGYPDTRIDYKHAFLSDPRPYLDQHEYAEYSFEDLLSGVNHYRDLMEPYIKTSGLPEYVLIELPALLYYSYPPELIASIDFPILVCRSNRVWSDADQRALDTILKFSERTCQFILNGVELNVTESVLGELPKKRSWFRKAVKRVVLLQFLSKKHL